MNPNKVAALSVLSQIEENRQFLGYYKNLKIPTTPAGKEQQVFFIGAKVKPSHLSRFKESIGIGEVYGFYSENGFGRYEVKWPNGSVSIEREKDLIVA